MKTIINASNLPANLVISNETDEVKNIPIFPDNGTLELKPQEQVIYQVGSSREYLYYYSTCKALGLTLEEESDEAEAQG